MFKEIAQNLKDNYKESYSEELHKLKLFVGNVQAVAEQQDITGTDYMHEAYHACYDDCYDALKILDSIKEEELEDENEPNCFEAEADFCRNNFKIMFV